MCARLRIVVFITYCIVFCFVFLTFIHFNLALYNQLQVVFLRRRNESLSIYVCHLSLTYCTFKSSSATSENLVLEGLYPAEENVCSIFIAGVQYGVKICNISVLDCK
jgi:hypothetical protein